MEPLLLEEAPPIGMIRPEFMKSPMLLGREIQLSLPNGEKHRAQFAIVCACDVIASHNERSFSDSEGYPTINGQNINDRNYKDDKNAQLKVMDVARDLDPNILISTSRTPAGTPIITTDGFVVSGNNRMMSIKLAIHDYPEKYLEYLKFLNEEAFAFGFDKSFTIDAIFGKEFLDMRIPRETFHDNVYIKIENPVLVRIDYDFPAYNTTELSKYNKDTKKSERPIDKAIKIGKILNENPNCKNIVAGIVGEFETFSEFYSDFKAQKKLVDTLVDCQIIGSQELSGYFYENGFTEAGKDLIENLLAGLILSKDALIASNIEGVKSFRNIIITSLPVLVKNSTLGNESLIPGINEAIILQAKIAQSKIPFENFINQSNMFDEKFSRKAAYLNRLLDEGRNTFKKSLEAYNDSVIDNRTDSLFGDKPSPEKIFRTHIEAKVEHKPKMVIENNFPEEKPDRSSFIDDLHPLDLWKQFSDGRFYRKFQFKDFGGDKVRDLLDRGIKERIEEKEHGITEATISVNSENEAETISEFFMQEFPNKPEPMNPEIIEQEAPVISNIVLEIAENVPEISENVPKVSNNVPEISENGNIVPSDTYSLLVGDSWFKQHPDKILGETFERSGRFGPTIEVKGGIENLDRIDAEIQDEKVQADQIMETVIQPTIEQEMTETAVENIKKSLSRSKVDYTERKVSDIEGEMYSFDEILAEYNPGITQDDIEAYVWYKGYIKDPLGGKWNRYKIADDKIEVKLTKWLVDGIVCWYKGSYMPAFMYYAENIYERIRDLRDEESSITEKFGKEQFDKQMTGLENVKPAMLTLSAPVSANENRRLTMLPVSKFAQEFFIDELNDGTQFHKWNEKERESVPGKQNLVYAFEKWLEGVPSNEFKRGTSRYEVVNYYLEARNFPRGTEKEEKLRVQQRSKMEGNRLFEKFLATALLPQDQAKIEYKWNSVYNGYVDVDYNKVPVAFEISKYFQNEKLFIRPEKREGVAFNFTNGSSCIAYDVGVGKTITALFALAQSMAAGYAKRPLIVVPNQTYQQWIQECKGKIVDGKVVYNGVLPQIPINDFYNLGSGYKDKLPVRATWHVAQHVHQWKYHNEGYPTYVEVSVTFDEKKGKYFYKETEEGWSDYKKTTWFKPEEVFERRSYDMVEEGSITFITYEGLEQIGISEGNEKFFADFIYDIVNQGTDNKRELSKLMEKVEKSVGKGQRNSIFNIEDFGFDFVCFDEAHKMKKSFTQVKGEVKESGEREDSRYAIQSGAPSDIAIKGLMISQYIFQNNNNRNVMLLTATPFTNSPLEIFSMLALIGYQRLKKEGLNNINEFFNTFVKTSTELVISPRLKPERKEIVMGFNNLITLQQLIYRFILYKTGEDVNIERPNKIVLPLFSKKNPVSGQLETLPEDQQISTFLPMSPMQKGFMDDIENYIRGEASLGEICKRAAMSELPEEESEGTMAGIELNEANLDDDEKAGVRVLRGLSYARLVALSPYLYPCSHLGEPGYKEYVETSPKFQYIMGCIKSVKKYHESKGEKMSGQIIYMNTGIDYFSLLKKYLVYELGFAEDEIGIIKSGMSAMAKNKIKDKFNEGKIHVVIGSATIKEGINLQKRSSVLYNCYLDWNPTDIKQLEGRLWRFGNEFMYVRITNPLVENSIDSFIFQKLEEKTSRINEIWTRTNRENDLKLEEFNPTELKMGLITDPRALAELQMLTDREKGEDEINGIETEIEVIKKFAEAKKAYDNKIDEFEELVDKYRPAIVNKETGKVQTRKFATKLALMEDIIKTGKDSDGSSIYLDYNERNLLSGIKEWYRVIARVERTYLIPKGLALDVNTGELVKSLELQIADKKKHLETETGKEAIDKLAQEIDAKRKEMNMKSATVEQRIIEFGRLNNLLSIKKVYGKKDDIIPIAEHLLAQAETEWSNATCPPLTVSGERDISERALAHLQHCIDEEPQTKNAHTDTSGNYTSERKALHDAIIAKFHERKPCMQEKPIAVLTGGPPGSGKSHFLKAHAKWLLSENVYHIDADEVRAKLPEYKGWNAPQTHLETKDIVDRLITEIGVPCKHDLVYDGTMNKAKNYLPLIERLKSLGYEVHIIYMSVPKEVSVQRVLDRYKRTGRYVPMEVIDEVYDLGTNAFDMLKNHVDGYIKIDGVTNEVIERGGKQIPENRNYQLSDGTGKQPELSTDDRRKTYDDAIQGYKTLITLTTDKKKKAIYRAAIDGYKTLLELMNPEPIKRAA